MGDRENTSARKGLKRKLAEAQSTAHSAQQESPIQEAARLVKTLQNTRQALLDSAGPQPPELSEYKATLRRAAHGLAELAKCEDNVDLVVDAGAVEAIVPLLDLASTLQEVLGSRCEASVADSWNEDVEKEACFAIGLLAIKQEHQRRVADAGALPGLVALLKRGPPAAAGPPSTLSSGGVARRAADSITNLAHENVHIKSRVRQEGGIPPLVALLESQDTKVQRAAAGALRTLAFKNEENKNLIVEQNALPMLIFMVRSEDPGIHYEAVGVIGNLVHSSAHIKKRVLDEGALQPVISLLSSRCTESQREAALLLGQFATTDPDYKVKIVQRGAVMPLIQMLSNKDPQLREMAAFALGRLAQNSDNQAGICHQGGLEPLLKLLESRNGSLQHNAAFALYGIADNEDNVAEIVRQGGVQRLMDTELTLQASKDCVQKTLKRLEEKVQGRVLNYLLYLMRMSERSVREHIVVALAHLAGEDDLYMIFVEKKGLDALLDMVASKAESTQGYAALALYTLAKKASALSPLEAAPPPPTPQVYLGESYINNSTLSDVTFVIEGRNFYAHRMALIAASDAFRRMFDEEADAGGAGGAGKVELPGLRLVVFEAIMQSVYTGRVDVTQDISQDLLQEAHRYDLPVLKRECEAALSQALSPENVVDMWDVAESYQAQQLAQSCVIFALENQCKVVAVHSPAAYTTLVTRMRHEIEDYIHHALRRPAERQLEEVMQRGAAV
mmetsp:Transcript_18316/g.62217  ORF Transcript_18316/g.62217 Transcript_18316/m.62217 type:complete len:731 (+) Transcript_18316:275-2467(+)